MKGILILAIILIIILMALSIWGDKIHTKEIQEQQKELERLHKMWELQVKFNDMVKENMQINTEFVTTMLNITTK